MAYKKWTKAEATLKPDPRYNSILASQFINCLMWDGKKTVAARIFYDALDFVEKKIQDKPPMEVFESALENVKPSVQVRSKRVGGSNYQVPMPVKRKRARSLAFRWLIDAARKPKGKPMSVCLAAEVLDAFNNTGTAVSTRDNMHRMAEANKAFAHFAW